jgi:hypothetical protein
MHRIQQVLLSQLVLVLPAIVLALGELLRRTGHLRWSFLDFASVSLCFSLAVAYCIAFGFYIFLVAPQVMLLLPMGIMLLVGRLFGGSLGRWGPLSVTFVAVVGQLYTTFLPEMWVWLKFPS